MPSGFETLNKGGDVKAKKIDILPGGSSLNLACRFMELASVDTTSPVSVEMRFIGCVGDDTQGALCFEHMKAQGVDTTNVIVKEGGQTGTCIVFSSDDDRSFVSEGGAQNDSFPVLGHFITDEEDMFRPLQYENLIHISGFYNIESFVSGALLSPLRTLSTFNTVISLNPQHDARNKWDGLDNILPHLTFLFVNEEELISIAKALADPSSASTGSTKGGRLKSDSSCNTILEKGGVRKRRKTESTMTIKDAAIHILGKKCDHVVVTKGSQGAIVFYHSDYEKGELVEAYEMAMNLEPDALVDTTGAGDAFAGGFLYCLGTYEDEHQGAANNGVKCSGIGQTTTTSTSALLKSLPKDGKEMLLRKCLRSGCMMGAHACTVVGGSTMDKQSLKKRLSDSK